MRTNATHMQLNDALKAVNGLYEDNITFNNLSFKGRQVHFTLKCKDSSKAGHRTGVCKTSKGNRRKMISACWHVHGDLFDALFDINNNIFIYSNGDKITSEAGNWNDKNIGSMVEPLYFSEACDCN